MTQLTPEELAACREIEAAVRSDIARRHRTATAKDFIRAGLSHARAEAAKEIADLNDSLSLAQTHVANLLIVESRLRDKIETLKAQVEGMKNVRLNIRHRDCHKAADAFWKYWKENGETHKNGYYEATWGAINSALKVVGVIDTAQEKPND